MGRLAFLLLFITNMAYGNSWHIINVDTLNLEYKNYSALNDKNRNALLYPESLKESVKLNLNTTVLLVGYVNQSVNGLTTDSQYRAIEYTLEVGTHMHELFDIYYYHQSSHLFDRPHSYMNRYPVEDALGIRINLIRSDNIVTIF